MRKKSKFNFNLKRTSEILIRVTGMRKIVRDSVIVKPKVERLRLEHGVKPEDLKEFVGPRDFLTKFNGVKQKMQEAKIAAKRQEDRQKRTFTHAGITVVTKSGV